jgi:hypothetical protein
MTALAESAITRRAFIYAAGKMNDNHWRKGWDSNPRSIKALADLISHKLA